jgi:hypothetical protein
MKDAGNVESIASFSRALFGGLYLMDCSVACQKKNLMASLTTLLMPFIRPQWVNYEVNLNQTKYCFRLIIGILNL